jgi:hypothetical protein
MDSPHDREYFAAAEGMADLYGRHPDSCTLPSVGDRIAYRTKDMSDASSESGRVVRVVAEAGQRATLVVEAENGQALRVIDPRPWPAGNLLPF